MSYIVAYVLGCVFKCKCMYIIVWSCLQKLPTSLFATACTYHLASHLKTSNTQK
jgi:hypothetical protein